MLGLWDDRTSESAYYIVDFQISQAGLKSDNLQYNTGWMGQCSHVPSNWCSKYFLQKVLSALSPSQQPSMYQNNTWTVKCLVYETIDPVTQRIILKIFVHIFRPDWAYTTLKMLAKILDWSWHRHSGRSLICFIDNVNVHSGITNCNVDCLTAADSRLNLCSFCKVNI